MTCPCLFPDLWRWERPPCVGFRGAAITKQHPERLLDGKWEWAALSLLKRSLYAVYLCVSRSWDLFLLHFTKVAFCCMSGWPTPQASLLTVRGLFSGAFALHLSGDPQVTPRQGQDQQG